ncbi:hypothetical protein CXR04_18685 [Streptomyces sp. CMB-StM0423]|nr:hypothetical protein CXR04_18685 [Streptomyces sp. CMB-StM0423]
MLAAPLPLLLPWTGRFLHAGYLSDVLGIPAECVHIPFYRNFFIALEPPAITAFVAVFLLGIAGWARYNHWWFGTRSMVALFVPLIFLVYVLTIMQASLESAGGAAEQAAADAQQGKRPGRYRGLQGELMCVKPLRKEIPVYNGPVPVDRPVLTFGNAGDDLWLWDPSGSRGRDLSRHALRVPAADVTLTPSLGGSCPPD